MDEVEFRIKYEAEKPIYEAWGNFVNNKILSELTKELGTIDNVKTFLMIYPPKIRIKGMDSIISKAFYRGKSYANPYEEITDKIGICYVVLPREHIKKVSAIIESIKGWKYSKDRDFEKEIEQYPLIFDYQSDHYIVRNLTNGCVPPGTPCEIQIRTILQHAYCELVHDTIYKKQTIIKSEIRRKAAKSMALIETTDDIFSDVYMTLAKENEQLCNYFKGLKSLYERWLTTDYEEKTNLFILDAFRELLETINISEIDTFLSDKAFLKDIICSKSKTNLLYRQPVILFLYYLIRIHGNKFKKLWPLTEAEAQPLYMDLGMSFGKY